MAYFIWTRPRSIVWFNDHGDSVLKSRGSREKIEAYAHTHTHYCRRHHHQQHRCCCCRRRWSYYFNPMWPILHSILIIINHSIKAISIQILLWEQPKILLNGRCCFFFLVISAVAVVSVILSICKKKSNEIMWMKKKRDREKKMHKIMPLI